TYTCNACNDLGCANSSVELTVHPFVIPTGPESLLACCKQQNLLPECLSACTVDIDVNLYLYNPHCMNEFSKLLKCAKDGVDHRQCCIYNGVPSSCLGYCDQGGDAPLNLFCLNFTSQILTCVQELHRSLPGPPVDIIVQQIPGRNALNVSWNPPLRNGKLVEVYIVYYKPSYVSNYLKFRTEKNWAVLTDLNVSATYEVTVTAVNQNGFSNFPPSVSHQLSAVAAHTGEGKLRMV
ncbi:unnamed protein product, partial [Soboliphyme baturini]|uniref:Fibronectin type-III domain-containing protein n=1 Tax=Soboliphyme baturini TaxID=241478 RepID=A0A183J7J6_9BILA